MARVPMTRPCPHEAVSSDSSSRDTPLDGGPARWRVGLVGIEPGWQALLTEWVGEAGGEIHALGLDGERVASPVCQLIVLGAAFPRLQATRQVERVRARWPGVPVLLLSPTFHAGIAPHGALARELGVDATVAMPVSRERLLPIMQRLVDGTE
jgi:DNA-binding response OmpR family regulator